MPVVLLLNKWLLGLLFFSSNLHPYHVSATELEYDAGHQRLEISTKIFTDDFEAVLHKVYQQRVDLSDSKLKAAMTTLIGKYISTHLQVRSDNKLLPVKLYGWEIDHEAVFVYTTADAKSFNAGNIEINNSILYDLFDDQVNIIHFIYKKSRKSTKLVHPESSVRLAF